ncbi:HNH endonuclease [Streptomyces prasinus]
MAKRTCSVPGCGEIHYGRGWCRLHYHRWWHHGSTDKPVRKQPPAPPCNIEGCEKPSADQGLCSAHWHQEKAQQPVPGKRRSSGGRPKVESGVPAGAKSCSSEGCGKKSIAKGLCGWHYQIARDARQPACSVEGCEAPERAKSLCANHYAYMRRHGVPSPQFTCEGCKEVFPGRVSTRHCIACKPALTFYAHERKARLALNNASMAEADFEESAAYRVIIKSDPCVYCGAASVAIDHVTPVAEGGSDRWENLAPVCKPCNSRKRSRSVLVVMLGRMAAP